MIETATRPAQGGSDTQTTSGVVGLRRRITNLVSRGVEAHAAADEAVDAATTEELRDFCRAHARWEAQKIQRQSTRSREQSVREAMAIGTSVEEATRILDAHPIALPDGRIAAFEEMTIPDHRARASWLGGQAKGLMQAAKIHQQVAALLAAENVGCVKDLRAAPKKRVRDMLTEAAA